MDTISDIKIFLYYIMGSAYSYYYGEPEVIIEHIKCPSKPEKFTKIRKPKDINMTLDEAIKFYGTPLEIKK